ncbi:MAG: hypothetical protein ACR2HR_08420 [Euzebya sp.]
MAGLNPRRLSGRVLQFSAKASRLPILGAGVRAAGKPLLGLERLRDARLDNVPPYLVPPPARRQE